MIDFIIILINKFLIESGYKYIIPEQNNKTYLVDFRKNEILNFNIKTDN